MLVLSIFSIFFPSSVLWSSLTKHVAGSSVAVHHHHLVTSFVSLLHSERHSFSTGSFRWSPLTGGQLHTFQSSEQNCFVLLHTIVTNWKEKKCSPLYSTLFRRLRNCKVMCVGVFHAVSVDLYFSL